MRVVRLCLTIVLSLVLPCLVSGQKSIPKSKTVPNDDWDLQPPTSLDEQKLKLERDRLELERTKVQEDRDDKKKSFYLSLIQVLGATLAIGLPIWLAVWQNRNEKVKRREEEALEFQLKAAEIAMNATDSNLVRGRAAALRALFPERLPQDFATSLDTAKIRFGPPGTQIKLDFLKILAENPENRKFLLDVWGLMWPGDADPNWGREPHIGYSWWGELKKYLTAQDEQPKATRSDRENSERDA